MNVQKSVDIKKVIRVGKMTAAPTCATHVNSLKDIFCIQFHFFDFSHSYMYHANRMR